MTDDPPYPVAVKRQFDNDFFAATRERRFALGYRYHEPFADRLPPPAEGGEGRIAVSATATLDGARRTDGWLDWIRDRLTFRWTAQNQEQFRSAVAESARAVAESAGGRELLCDDVSHLEERIAEQFGEAWDGPPVRVESVSVESITLGPFAATHFLLDTCELSFNDAVEFPDGYSTDDVVAPEPGEDVAVLHPYVLPPAPDDPDETLRDVVEDFEPGRAGRSDLDRLRDRGIDVDADAATERDLIGNRFLVLPEGHCAFDAIEGDSNRQRWIEELRVLGTEFDDVEVPPPEDLRGMNRDELAELRLRTTDELSPDDVRRWAERIGEWKAPG